MKRAIVVMLILMFTMVFAQDIGFEEKYKNAIKANNDLAIQNQKLDMKYDKAVKVIGEQELEKRESAERFNQLAVQYQKLAADLRKVEVIKDLDLVMATYRLGERETIKKEK